jgi:hypothetical protein
MSIQRGLTPLWAILPALLLVSNAEAAKLAYTCVIKAVYDLGDQGYLRPSAWNKDFGGDAFSVSRLTGQIIGTVVPTLNATSTEVINQGGSAWSFRAIVRFEKSLQLIEIKEFKKGENKPFVVASMGGAGIVTGVCK